MRFFISRDHSFHTLFPEIPASDRLIEDYGCALQKDITMDGRLYISENHLCFFVDELVADDMVTKFIIPFHEVTGLEKKMTTDVFKFPNAIQISSHNTRFTFTNFLSCAAAYDVMYSAWRSSRSESEVSKDGEGVAQVGAVASAAIHKPTHCACGKEGKHLEKLVMDIVVPGTPEAIFNLMFTSGFWKEFATGEQVFMDIQMSDWQPQQPGSRLLMRNMTYLKPLQGPVDPKLTKCELKDEVLHAEFDDYVSVLTTVRTPNVPSAHMFVVKTRTCIMWAGAAASRLVVTTTVEWTGKSFFRSMIDQYTIDGQRQYYTDLEKAMRLYIFAHSPEFIPDYVAEDREALSWLESVPNEGADSRGGSPSFGYSHPIQPVEVAPLGELPSPALPTRQDYEILPSPSLTENTTIVKPLGVTPHNIHHSPVPTESSTDSAGNGTHFTNKGVLGTYLIWIHESCSWYKPLSQRERGDLGITLSSKHYAPQLFQTQSTKVFQKYMASVMYKCLIKHGCTDLTSSIDPLKFSSSPVAEGGSGDIWTGRSHNSGIKLAIKVLRLSLSTGDIAKKELKRTTREIYNWSKLDHENVNKLMGVIMFQERLGMVSEWMEQGNLRQYLSRNSGVDRYELCVQIAMGVAYLHGVNMVHGDLKAHNILVSSAGILKITDFDYSIIPECSLAFSVTTRMGGGTSRWMAPELLLNENTPQRNKTTDIYALGMTFLETMTGVHPYSECNHETQILLKHMRKEHPIRPMKHFPYAGQSNRMWSLLVQCWNYDPISRPIADDVLQSILSLKEETGDAS